MKNQKKNRGQKFRTLTARLDKKESDMIERIGKISGETQATKIIFKALEQYEYKSKELERCKVVIEEQNRLIETYSQGAMSMKHAFESLGIFGEMKVKMKKSTKGSLMELLEDN